MVPTVGVAGQDVYYDADGRAGRNVVFVHGFRNSSESWAPVRGRIPTGVIRAWFLDLPGCGRSATPSSWEACTVDAYVDCLYRFCSELGLADVVLVGHSLGGGIAMTVALEHPELLHGLVLVAPTPADGIGYLSESQLASLIDPTEIELEALARAAFHRAPAEEDFERLLATVRAASRVHVEGAVRSQRDMRVAARLAEINTPTLVVGGDRDRHVPIRHTLRTAAAIRRCSVQIYHNVGHVPFFEVPDDFAALIDRFILSELASE